MIERFIDALDPHASAFLESGMSMVSIKAVSSSRTSKNPDSDYESDAVSLHFEWTPSQASIEWKDTGKVSMCITFVQEADLLISQLTTGVLHSGIYKVRKYNLIERFNRMTAVLMDVPREKKGFLKVEGADID